MRAISLFLWCTGFLLLTSSTSAWAQTPVSSSKNPAASSPTAPSADANSSPAPDPLPVDQSPATPPPAEAAAMPASSFLDSGVPTAKVLYMEGDVRIKPPGDDTYHELSQDEPIPAKSSIRTGSTGILDFATGPGMALRAVPDTQLRVAELPAPATTPAPAAPAAPAPVATPSTPAERCAVYLKQGTVFTALGRKDNQPVDFEVHTPEGVAGARGTMFATSVSGEQTNVSMLHGTVNFETPDHQVSQIPVGQSQQISSVPGGKYQLGKQQKLDPSNSTKFFNNAGGLLDHSSGAGVVRHSLGPDVAKGLNDHGYKLPAETQRRFENTATSHYQPSTHNQPKPGATHANAKPSNPIKGNPAPGAAAANHPYKPVNEHPARPRKSWKQDKHGQPNQ